MSKADKTKGNKGKKSKGKKLFKPKKLAQVAEISFNPEERHEFITGFHQRKLALKNKKIKESIDFFKEEKRIARRAKDAQLAKMMPQVDLIQDMNDEQRVVHVNVVVNELVIE